MLLRYVLAVSVPDEVAASYADAAEMEDETTVGDLVEEAVETALGVLVSDVGDVASDEALAIDWSRLDSDPRASLEAALAIVRGVGAGGMAGALCSAAEAALSGALDALAHSPEVNVLALDHEMVRVVTGGVGRYVCRRCAIDEWTAGPTCPGERA